VSSAATGDPAVSWDAVAERLRPYLLRQVGSAADADDVLQEVLLKMHASLGSLRDSERLVPWAFGIARRSVVDHKRARGRRPIPTGAQPADVQPADAQSPGADPHDSALPASSEASEGAEALLAVIASFVAALPSPYREAVVLTELEGLSQREAAARMGVSVTAMKSRVQRGRHKLRGMIERCCAVELDARNRIVAVSPRPDGEIPFDCCGGGCGSEAASPQPPVPSADAELA